MINIEVLKTLLLEKEAIESALQERGEGNIRFYNASGEGGIGIISDYRASMDQAPEKGSEDYLKEKLSTDKIQFNHSADSILTDVEKEEAEEYPYRNTLLLIDLFEKEILPDSLQRKLSQNELDQINQFKKEITSAAAESLMDKHPGIEKATCTEVFSTLGTANPTLAKKFISDLSNTGKRKFSALNLSEKGLSL